MDIDYIKDEDFKKLTKKQKLNLPEVSSFEWEYLKNKYQ